MEKKTFFNAIKKVFLEYGFKNNKKTYWIEYEEVIVFAYLMKARFDEAYNFLYDFSIKKLHENEEQDFFSKTDLIGLYSFYSQNGKCDFYHERMTEEELITVLKEMIERYIFPFKKNAYDYIRNALFAPWGSPFILTEQAKAFLGIPEICPNNMYEGLLEILYNLANSYEVVKASIPFYMPVSSVINNNLTSGLKYDLNDIKKDDKGLPQVIKSKIMEIVELLEKAYIRIEHGKDPILGTEESYKSHPFWQKVRNKAQRILDDLKEPLKPPIKKI